MALGTQYWDKVVSYPDFSTSRPNLSSIPNDFAVNAGGYCIVDSNEVITRTAISTPFATYKCTFNGTAYWSTGSAIYDGTAMDDFTYEAWIYPTNVTGIHMLFGGSTGQYSIYLNGTTLEVGRLNVLGICGTAVGSVPINTWTKVAVSKIGTTVNAYVNNVLGATGSVTMTLVTTGLYRHGRSYLDTYGFIGDIAEVLITLAGKTSFSPLTSTYPRYAAQILGNIVEVSPITSWTITGVSPTGLVATTTTTGSTYTLNCPSLELYTITCAPTVNGKWAATTAISLGYFVVPSNPNTNPVIYVCTTAGTTSSTEPVFTATTYTDGTVVWTRVGSLVNPIALGAKIPS
jgi:hypothetical protein